MKRNSIVVTATSTLCLALAACGASSPGSAISGAQSTVPPNCKPQHVVSTVTTGQLSVAAYEYPPFAEVRGQQLSGAEGEIITRIAQLECLTVKVVPGAAAAMIPSITTGRADSTIGSWYRTAAREKVVLLSQPVIADRLTLVSKTGVATIAGLKGRQVGSILGFVWNDNLKNLLGGDLKLYETGQVMYADLAAGRISVVVDTYPSAQALLKKTPIPGLTFDVPPADPAVTSTEKPGQTNFPVNKNNPALAAAFDADIAALRASGELERIVVSFGFQPAAATPGAPNTL